MAMGVNLIDGCSFEVVLPPGDGAPTDDGPTGGGAGDGGAPGGIASELRVAFDPRGGYFAVGEDDAGNQYAFRAKNLPDGGTVVSEAVVQQADGQRLTASLDSNGRPVNFRASDNSAADLVYEGDTVRVRLTDAQGNVVADTTGLDAAAARERVAQRRRLGGDKTPVRSQTGLSVQASLLFDGLDSYEEITFSLFDGDYNPDSPLATAGFREAALDIAEIVSVVEFVEVERIELPAVIIVDDTPDVIERLAGQTFVLFDAEGFCLEWTDVANRLTFDIHGVLQSEFDRHLVFADFSLGGGADPGVTVNYAAGTPIVLAPEDDTFSAVVTPVFTATQVDDFGRITIERRFAADISFEADIFGPGLGSASRLFDAALVNGELSADGDVLEFDLVLIDLADQTAIASTGRLRYHNQNSPEPFRVYDCELAAGPRVTSQLICPASIELGDSFEAVFVAGREYLNQDLLFDWFVSQGYGLILDDPFADRVEVLPTEDGFLELTLLVSSLSGIDETVQVQTCGVNVGRPLDDLPPLGELIIECPAGLNIGETGFLSVSGSGTLGLDFVNWYVFGTAVVVLSDPFDFETTVSFYSPGRFTVAFQAFDAFGEELYVTCEILVGGLEIDECEIYGWYGDGECDEFCPAPDPDCDVFIDICEVNGWYGDGECDDFCPGADPDCQTDVTDICFENDWYGDGECDLFCPLPDPDCDEYDFCEDLGYYGDGFCDLDCPFPDPDCG
jgi:hypothetical protein